MKTGASNEQVGVFIRYCISGGIAAVMHFSVLILLIEWVGLNPTLASATGFCAATCVNYSLQYYWTFMATGPHSVIFARYVMVTLTMLGVNTGLFWTLNEVYDIHYVIAQAAAIGTVVLFNFIINQRYTFTAPVAK